MFTATFHPRASQAVSGRSTILSARASCARDLDNLATRVFDARIAVAQGDRSAAIDAMAKGDGGAGCAGVQRAGGLVWPSIHSRRLSGRIRLTHRTRRTCSLDAAIRSTLALQDSTAVVESACEE